MGMVWDLALDGLKGMHWACCKRKFYGGEVACCDFWLCVRVHSVEERAWCVQVLAIKVTFCNNALNLFARNQMMDAVQSIRLLGEQMSSLLFRFRMTLINSVWAEEAGC